MTSTNSGDKRYAALPFEAVKVSLRQNKDGVVVSFVVHPDDLHPAIMTDPVGTRYQLVAVRLGDDGQPVREHPQEPQKPGKEASSPPPKGQDMSALERAQANVVASAGIVCRDPRFHEWVGSQLKRCQGVPATEVEAIGWLLNHCGVSTRVALKTSTEARAKFFAMREAFEEWKDATPPA